MSHFPNPDASKIWGAEDRPSSTSSNTATIGISPDDDNTPKSRYVPLPRMLTGLSEPRVPSSALTYVTDEVRVEPPIAKGHNRRKAKRERSVEGGIAHHAWGVTPNSAPPTPPPATTPLSRRSSMQHHLFSRSSPRKNANTVRHDDVEKHGEVHPEGSHTSSNGQNDPPQIRRAASNGTVPIEEAVAVNASVSGTNRRWIPLPLVWWHWSLLIATTVGGAIALELVLLSTKERGWRTDGGALGYKYAISALSLGIAASWMRTGREIQKLMPYLILASRQSPAEAILMLDYSNKDPLVAFLDGAQNQHWLVVLTAYIMIVTFVFQPVTGVLFEVRSIPWVERGLTVTNLGAISLSPNSSYGNYSALLNAAGFASANILYDVGDPEFVYGNFTIAPFEIPYPTNANISGTLDMNTTAVETQVTCEEIGRNEFTMIPIDGNLGINFMISHQVQMKTGELRMCDLVWDEYYVNRLTYPMSDTRGRACDLDVTDEFAPVMFYYVNAVPNIRSEGGSPNLWGTLTICKPELMLWDVEVNFDLATRSISSLRILSALGQDLSPLDELSKFAGNITDAPLYQQAYNGMYFRNVPSNWNLESRLDAVRLLLPASILQASLTHGFVDITPEPRLWASLATRVYTSYLTLVAKQMYFIEYKRSLAANLVTERQRMFLNPLAVHLLAAAMTILVFGGTAMVLWTLHAARQLHLRQSPGTIASALSTGVPALCELLGGNPTEDETKEALRGKLVSLNPKTGKIEVVDAIDIAKEGK